MVSPLSPVYQVWEKGRDESGRKTSPESEMIRELARELEEYASMVARSPQPLRRIEEHFHQLGTMFMKMISLATEAGYLSDIEKQKEILEARFKEQGEAQALMRRIYHQDELNRSALSKFQLYEEKIARPDDVWEFVQTAVSMSMLLIALFWALDNGLPDDNMRNLLRDLNKVLTMYEELCDRIIEEVHAHVLYKKLHSEDMFTQKALH